jgi:cell filamentation protein
MLEDLQARMLEEVDEDQRITVADLCAWHRDWLDAVYEWAGEFRSVNLQKGKFMFAAANQIPRLMAEYEDKYLAVYTPCEGFDENQLVGAVAVCHVELIIIHPFREGNGRLSRVLATIMALQAGMPLLNFTYLAEHQDEYIAAIHHGHAGNYAPMKRVFSEVLQASRREG